MFSGVLRERGKEFVNLGKLSGEVGDFKVITCRGSCNEGPTVHGGS